jgi:hypothetical protein
MTVGGRRRRGAPSRVLWGPGMLALAACAVCLAAAAGREEAGGAFSAPDCWGKSCLEHRTGLGAQAHVSRSRRREVRSVRRRGARSVKSKAPAVVLLPTSVRDGREGRPTGTKVSKLEPSAALEADAKGVGAERSGPVKPEIEDGAATMTPVQTEARVNRSSLLIIRPAGFPEGKPVCRLQGLCQSGDGAYLLPHWMKRYAGHIDRCGLRGERHYVLRETRRSTAAVQRGGGDRQTGPDLLWSIDGLSRPKVRLSEDFSAYDMIGGTAPRELMHWMVTDLTPSLYMMDMAARFPEYARDGRITSMSCVKDTGEACDQADAFPSVNPFLLVDVRISEQQSHHWPKGLLRLMRNGFGGGLQIFDAQDLYGWRLRSQASCFKSLITTEAQISDLPPGLFASSHIVWRANGLTRETVLRDRPGENAPESPACTVRVLLLNKYGKRYMVGHDKLRLAIQDIAKRVVGAKYPGIQILSETAFFDKSSFHEQVSVMQECNIVVSSHGSSNANIMFLRPDTTVIEVMPFGLETSTYSSIAKAFGVKYSMITAQPDGEVFQSCVNHFNPGPSADVTRMMKEWMTHAASFRNASAAHRRNPTTEFRIPDSVEDGPAASHFRQCASYQRLSFNVEHVAKTVAKVALDQCGIAETSFIL